VAQHALSPSDHYREVQRLLAALPTHGLTTDQTLFIESVRVIATTILATAHPRRVRRREHPPTPAAGGPSARWTYCGDETP